MVHINMQDKKKPQRKKYGNAVHVPSSEKLDRIPLTDFSNIQELPADVHNDHTYVEQCKRSQLTVVSDSTVSLTNDVQHTTVNSNVGTINIASTSLPALANYPTSTSVRNVTDGTTINSNFGTINVASTSSTPITMNPLLALLQSAALLSQPRMTSTPQITKHPKPPNVKSSHPFILIALNNRIKKCAGCTLLIGIYEKTLNGNLDILITSIIIIIKKSYLLQRHNNLQFPLDIQTLQVPVNASVT